MHGRTSTALMAAMALAWFGAGSAAASAPAAPPGCGSPTATSFTQSTPVPLADNGVVTSTLVVSGMPTRIRDVDAVTTITHTTSSEIDMTLTSPAGTVVTLTTDNGGSLDNVFNGTTWDDDAAPGGDAPATFALQAGHVQVHPYTNNVVATPLAPEEALGAFIGENPNGTWTLTVSDDVAGVTGTLNSWGLDVQANAAAPATSRTTASNDADVTIPVTGTSVNTSTIAISGADSYLSDVDVLTDIAHTFSGDLQIALTSPAGTKVYLTSGILAGSSDVDDIFAGTTWDDSADHNGQVPYGTNANLATDHPYVNGVAATPLAPSEALAAFIGEDPNGTWTLEVADQFSGDGGTLRSWGLDITTARCGAPETTIESGPADGGVTASSEATFTWTGTPHAAIARFDCALDGESLHPCGGGRHVSGLADGQHTFRVAAVAVGGTPDPTPAERTWTVDTTPPDTQIDSGPAAGSSVASRSAAFTYSGIPAGDAASFRCSLDGAPPAPCPATGIGFDNLVDGPHVFRVVAVDVAGNADGAAAERAWTVAAPPVAAPPVAAPPVAGPAPRVLAFAVTPGRPRAGRALTLWWRLSSVGEVKVVFHRLVKGRRQGKRCVTGRRTGKRCTLAEQFGRVAADAGAGAGTLELPGRVGTRRLVPGRYRASLTASTGGGQPGPPRRVTFTVRR